ncbi:ATP-dependent RecD-like DNA helicase [Micromonospora sp. MW-13]|uniref:AAA domain-containing protein n=1 Tax=Micromonospora sp. MW-13 TaxID=2094022 RepID=UPI000E43C22E|nr:AAA domain-containing protein [Micromonospora sp. MW-13]RGC69723.1 ATP-dependent RecD-like DNA helicase [Micromonospora sp. MW-13]
MGRHALLLGTAACHVDRELAPLPSVRQDVAQLKAMLDGAGEFDTVRAELDLPAAHLRQVVEEFYGARRNGDLALLYYSGHGVLHGDGQSLFLAATDTVCGQLHTTAFDTDGTLRHLLNHTKASQKVVLLDCCFSGAFTARHRFRGGVREEPRRAKRERGTFILTSSTHLKASKAQGPDRPSVFTEVLLTGLRGAAEGTADDGWITTNDLSRYALTEMARRRQHTPVESSEGVTEPIRLATVPGSAAAARQVVAATASPGDEAPFDADQWRRLVTYYVNCMRRSTVLQSFIDPQATGTYVAAPPGSEAVLTSDTPVRLSGGAAGLAARARADGREVQYGYPVVAIRPGRGRPPRLAPLLVCDVTVGADDVLHASLPPRPSSALVDLLQLSEVEADELRQRVEQVFVPGDPAALVATVDVLTKTFGLNPVVELDPAMLVGTIRPGPMNGVQNAAILYTVDAAESPQRQLVDDLRGMIKNPRLIERTALGALALRPDEVPSTPVVTVALNAANEAQEEIIQAAMSQPLTVAQGPPGTGKSQLVTALLATATAAGQSVLIGSTSNQAVDSVLGRVTDLIGPGLLVRTGNKEHRLQEPKHLADILAAYPPAEHRSTPDDRTPLHELRLLADKAAELRGTLDERRLLERDLADLAVERDSDPAAGSATLPEDDRALAQLVHLTDRALASRWFGWWYRWRLRAYRVVDRDAVEALAERAVIELRWRERRQRLAELPDGDASWRQLVDLIGTERPALSIKLLRAQIARRVAAGARLLQDRADEMAKPQSDSWAYFPEMLRVLPGWAVTALSARRLRRSPALYDLVVIDEAAQCTIPAILPMLYRAKRALIIGDPRQLAPVVDLPEADDVTERARAEVSTGWLTTRRLTYTGHSAYDAFAAAAGATHLLDEHYRCHPDIVEVPNREVYQGRLTVLTDPARLAAPADQAVRWRDVPGRFSPGATGSGCNQAEIDQVVTEVAHLRTTYPDASIGVVTPLAAHQRRLATALRDAGLTDNLLCATIHKFQGSERDIMVVSPVGAHGIPDRTRGWLVHQTNLWNVAITRARSQLVVVGDRSWWSGQRGLLTALALGRDLAGGVPDAAMVATDRLHRALREAGLAVRRDVPVAGRTIGLFARHADVELAVVVDDPTGSSDGRGLRKVLARLDITADLTPVRRVPAWRCLAEPERVAAELTDDLRRSAGTDAREG